MHIKVKRMLLTAAALGRSPALGIPGTEGAPGRRTQCQARKIDAVFFLLCQRPQPIWHSKFQALRLRERP